MKFQMRLFSCEVFSIRNKTYNYLALNSFENFSGFKTTQTVKIHVISTLKEFIKIFTDIIKPSAIE